MMQSVWSIDVDAHTGETWDDVQVDEFGIEELQAKYDFENPKICDKIKEVRGRGLGFLVLQLHHFGLGLHLICIRWACITQWAQVAGKNFIIHGEGWNKDSDRIFVLHETDNLITPELAFCVSHFNIYAPSLILKQGIAFMDLPGLNDMNPFNYVTTCEVHCPLQLVDFPKNLTFGLILFRLWFNRVETVIRNFGLMLLDPPLA